MSIPSNIPTDPQSQDQLPHQYLGYSILGPDLTTYFYYPNDSSVPPHEINTSQGHQSFWNQFPSQVPAAYDRYRAYPSPQYNKYHSHTMDDDRPTVIGSKSRYARKSSPPGSDGKLKAPRPKPEMVDIYVGDKFVKAMPLRLLTRFSTRAAREFPKPESLPEQEGQKENVGKKHSSTEVEAQGEAVGNNEGAGGTERRKWADSDGEETNVAKMTAQMEKLAPMGGGKKAATKNDQEVTTRSPESTKAKVEGKTAESPKKAADIVVKDITIAADKSSRKQFVLPEHHDDREQPWEMPATKAVQTCLDWMELNSRVHGHERLIDFHIPAHGSLRALVEVYSAIGWLELRPFPNHVRGALLETLTEYPTTADQLYHLFYHVRYEDVVLTRCVTSIVEHDERGTYNEAQNQALKELLAKEKNLAFRYNKVKKHRNYIARQAKGMAGIEAGWGELENEFGAGEKRTINLQSTAGPPHDGRRNGRGQQNRAARNDGNGEGKGKGKQKAGSEVKVEVPKRMEPVKGGNGKGVGGRHVPGAV